jgi:hypothetical protein
VKGGCEKIGTAGRAGISTKFYICGHLEGEGNKALQIATFTEVFRRESSTQKGAAVKLFRYPNPPSELEAIFHSFRGVGGDQEDIIREWLN